MSYQLTTRSRRLLADTVTPVGLFLRLRDQYANCLLLESADYHGQQNAFSYLVCEPLATFELHRGGVLRQLLPGAPETTETLAHPREALSRLRDFAAAGTPDASAEKLPFISTGLFGYMGYEAVQSFEDVTLDPAKVPAGDIPLIRYGVYRYVIASSSWHRTPAIKAPIDRPQLLGYGRDQDTVMVSQLEGDTWQVHEVRLADGSWSAPLTDLGSDNVIRDRATRTVIGTQTADMAGYQYDFFAAADQKLWDALIKAFPGEAVSFVDWTDDRMVAVVEVEGGVHGDAYFLVDRRLHTADWLADRYHDITATAVNERRVLHYKAGDGLDIPAYLTLPRDRPAKGLPLVVLAHGGPASRDDPGFDWWSQALAARGYAVLQPQFRGSEGFGTDFLAAGYGQWGRKMQTDLSDGVRQLVKDGLADPKRVCIMGASYGGYAALAGVALDGGVYRCAVAVAGVSDLRRKLRAEASRYSGARNDTVRYWQRFMGARSVSDNSIDAWSPALHADAIKVPVLLIHGKDDTVVPYVQSTVMADAMKKVGGDVELVTLNAEDHWLSRGATRVQMLEATVAFLEKHNPPGASAAAPATAAQ